MRDAGELHPHVPALPEEPDGKQPLLALQVTVFPGSGVCVGIVVHHTATDGTGSVAKTVPSFDAPSRFRGFDRSSWPPSSSLGPTSRISGPWYPQSAGRWGPDPPHSS
ncbi:hypothetical protein H6P81_011129 [Aristolochia fimbriata]|uniref:Uncharacterized protein n=1 Tax=Aristolochia fimbriata TaxID=158543 RepID=A0AAV7ERW7_ARIFI|nr:hypothetical protein H6P81_011129 [Aristolochia fimbriata]